MEAILQRLLPAISNNELFTDSPQRLQPFHIYFKLKDFYREMLSPADSMKMYIHHLKHEKCMSLLRQRNLEGATSLLSEIHQADRLFPPFVQAGMDSFHYAMLAYADYILFADQQEALRKLKVAIEKGEAQSSHYPYFSLSIPTQWINVLRLVIRSGDEARIIEEATDLLALCLFGFHPNKQLLNAYNTLGNAEHVLIVGDVFDNVISNLEKSSDFSYAAALINTIIANVFQRVDTKPGFVPGVVHVLKLLCYIDQKNYETFAVGLWSERQKLIDIPDSLKRILAYWVRHLLTEYSQQSAIACS